MSLESHTITDALEAIAANRPTPGGGAVASLTAALAAATGRMVLSFSIGRKKYAAHEELHEDSMDRLAKLSAHALQLAERDAEAYGRLNTLWKLDEDDPERREHWDGAVAAAIDAPRAVIETASEMLGIFRRLPGATNRHLRSDLAVAAVLAEAAVRAAAWNVSINLPLVGDESQREGLALDAERAVLEAKALSAEIERQCG